MSLSWGTCRLLPLDLNLGGALRRQLSWVSSVLCSWVSRSLIVNLLPSIREGPGTWTSCVDSPAGTGLSALGPAIRPTWKQITHTHVRIHMRAHTHACTHVYALHPW